MLRAVKLFESRSVQVGRLVFSAQESSDPGKERPSNGHYLPEDDASRNCQLNCGLQVALKDRNRDQR
jgi:hypothetical protein